MVVIERLVGSCSQADIRALADLLLDAVQSGAAVSFLLDLTKEDAQRWWRNAVDGASARAIFLVARDASGIVGTVQLQPAWAPNQPQRADVAKLIVHRRGRNQGLGERLMRAIVEQARTAGFKLLTLDTKRGCDAERLYQRLGWKPIGVIPRFALDPDGKGWHDDALYYLPLE